jgi:DNA-binding transcriptional MerR regulator
MSDSNFIRIGELARRFGVTPRTIRYYEELGLLEPSSREESEHRRYPEQSVIHLKRIEQLKDYGLSLAEIKDLFDLAKKDRSGRLVREGLRASYAKKLEAAKERRAALDNYIDDLSWHIDQLDRVNDFFQCPGAACATCDYRERCDVRHLVTQASE